MKYAIKCKSLHEKLAIMEYLKNNQIAFQETAWSCRAKDFDKYPFVYFDDYYRHVGSTHRDEDLQIVSMSVLLEKAINSQKGSDLATLRFNT